jgi:uncharacterized protein involved in exopolysaccharide biosynthesis
MESGEGRELHQYWALMWRALRRRRWLALGLFLAGGGPLWAYTLLMEPRYEATGVVWLEERTVNVVPDLHQRGQLPVLLTILQSRHLAASVVDALPRRAYDEILRKRLHTDWLAKAGDRLRILLGRPIADVTPREQVISELLDARMTFTPKGNMGILEVKATASNPAIAADIATAYIETLRNRTRVFTSEESRAVRELLESQAKQVGANLRVAEDDLAQFERQRGLVRIDDRIKASLDTLNQAEASLSGTILSEDVARTRLAAIKAELEGRPAGKKVTETIAVPPELRSLYDRWQAAETRVAALTKRYTDAHPQVRAAREEAQEVGPRVTEALRQQLNITTSPKLPPAERALLIDQALTLAEEIWRLHESRQLYEAQVRDVKAALGTLSRDQRDFARRRQAVETNKSLHDLLTRKTEEANLGWKDDLRNIRVLDPPRLPLRPSGRLALMIALAGMGLGLGAALGLPLGLELLDNTLKTEEEAEAALGWPVLGTILAMDPRAALADKARSRALPARASGRKRSA